jgi:dolichol-phosphate hexosyltransferase
MESDVFSLVLLPAMNEEEGIGLTLNELRECLNGSQDAYYLVVDGNSKDRTVEVAKELGAEVVTQTGKGKGNAIECALNYINTKKIRYIILTDADHTYPAQYIPEMIQLLNDNPNVGMVCGNRFNSTLPCDSGGYRFYIGNKILSSLHYFLNGINLNDPLTGLRVIRWNALKDWKPKSKGFDIEVELNHYIGQQKYLIKEIDIPYRERLGTKKLKVRHGFVILERIFKQAFEFSHKKLFGGNHF